MDLGWNLASAVDRNQRKLPMIHVKHRVNSSYPLTHELGGPLGRVKGKPRRETAHLPNGGESSFISSSSSSLVGERSRCREHSGLIVISHHPVVCYHFSPPSPSHRAPFHRNDWFVVRVPDRTRFPANFVMDSVTFPELSSSLFFHLSLGYPKVEDLLLRRKCVLGSGNSA